MFGLGMPEILLILAIALIVIGPQKLPELAKTLGRAMGEFKRSAQDFKRSIDMDTTLQDVKSSTMDVTDGLKDDKHKKTRQQKQSGTADESKEDTASPDGSEEAASPDTSSDPDPAADADTARSWEQVDADTDTDKENKNG